MRSTVTPASIHPSTESTWWAAVEADAAAGVPGAAEWIAALDALPTEDVCCDCGTVLPLPDLVDVNARRVNGPRPEWVCRPCLAHAIATEDGEA